MRWRKASPARPDGVPAPAGRTGDPATRRVFAILLAGGLAGVLAILPYVTTLLDGLPAQAGRALPPLAVLLVLQVLQATVLIAGATALGLWLGPTVGLGAPLLYALVRGEPGARRRLVASLPLSALLGVAVGAAILLLDRWVFGPPLAAAGRVLTTRQPPAWQGLLASLYGGVVEELLLRLGLMTLLVWAAFRLTRSSVVGPGTVWFAIVASSLVFGLGHLPTTAALMPLSALAVTRALVLNGLGGLVFGWLYWRRGLVAAMAAHASADVVLHVLAAALAG